MVRIFLGLCLLASVPAWALPACPDVVRSLNDKLTPPIQDTRILADTLSELQRNGRLPTDRYVDKRAARNAGWTPGMPFNQIDALKGKRMGGDRFANRERRLPTGEWTEADLDYRGGKRNAKRLVFSARQRFVTTDHYQTFVEIPPCQ